MDVCVEPGQLCGGYRAPGSKSVSIRALACAGLARGTSLILAPSLCDDSLAAIRAVRALGAQVQLGSLFGLPCALVRGSPPDRWVKKEHISIDCGESALCMRMFACIAALSEKQITLTACSTLATRSMAMLESQLAAFGASCVSKAGYPPLVVRGPLHAGSAVVDGSSSSQSISGLLSSLPLCSGSSELVVNNAASSGYLDITEQVMKRFGVRVRHREPEASGPDTTGFDATAVPPSAVRRSYHIAAGAYRPAVFRVEGDWSSAAFILAAAASTSSAITVKGVRADSVQPDKAVLNALSSAGIVVKHIGPDSFRTAGAQKLRPFSFDASQCPDLFPPLVALASRCPGHSHIAGVDRLVGKESNRVLSLVTEFAKLGVTIRISGQTMQIEGLGPGTRLRGGVVESHGDHRIAMACAVAALSCSSPLTIRGAECVSKSWPDFFSIVSARGYTPKIGL